MELIDKLNSIKDPNEFLEFLNTHMKYGYIDKNGNANINTLAGNKENYLLYPINTLLTKGVANCGDMVEIERYFFLKEHIKHNTYSIKNSTDPNNVLLHCFLTFEINNELFLFEQSWKYYRGITKFNSKEELMLEMLKRFIIRHDITSDSFKNCSLVEFNKPNLYITFTDYINMLNDKKNLIPYITNNMEFEEVKYHGFEKI